MAASMAASMRSLGLLPLSAAAAWRAFNSAGCSPQLVHAKLDLGPFCVVNQARSAWPFLAALQQVPKVRSGSQSTQVVALRLEGQVSSARRWPSCRNATALILACAHVCKLCLAFSPAIRRRARRRLARAGQLTTTLRRSSLACCRERPRQHSHRLPGRRQQLPQQLRHSCSEC